MDSRKNIKASAVKAELLENQSPELLKELHLLTRDGHLNADARRKLKQINHLYKLIEPALSDLATKYDDFTVLDVGAGKAYLGFIIYELFFKPQGKGHLISVESRADLVERGTEMAKRLGFDRMEFIHAPMAQVKLERPVHLVTALHACDTATDDALVTAVKMSAPWIAVVPCCQAEVARLLQSDRKDPMSEIWRHGIHRREFGSHITNVIRALTLESLGYQVTVTELVGWEHSLKNEFILAKKFQKENGLARRQLQGLLDAVKVKPQIVRDLLS